MPNIHEERNKNIKCPKYLLGSPKVVCKLTNIST